MIGLGWCCPVCGWNGFERPVWGDGLHDEDICPCCGFWYGVWDSQPNEDGPGIYEEYRRQWLDERGGKWTGSWRQPPDNWDRDAQVAAIERDTEGFRDWFAMAVRGVLPAADLRTADGTDVAIFGANDASTELVQDQVLKVAAIAEPGRPLQFRLVGSTSRFAELEQGLPRYLAGWTIRRREIEYSRPQAIMPASDGSPWAEAVLASAPFLANHCKGFGFDLDFSVESLHELDRLFDARHRTKDSPLQIVDAGLGMLAYMGEVIRQAIGGQWTGPKSTLTRDYGLLLTLPDGSLMWPGQRLRKRFSTKFGPPDDDLGPTPFQEAVQAVMSPMMHEGRRLFEAYSYAAGLGIGEDRPVRVLELIPPAA